MSKVNYFVRKARLTAIAVSAGIFGLFANASAVDYEAEAFTISASSPAAAVVSGQSGSSGNAFTCFNTAPTSAGTYYIELTTPSLAAGTYSLSYLYKGNSNRGRFQVSVDGVNVGGIGDQYAANQTNQMNMNVGNVTLSASGTHSMRWTTNSKNASSSGYQTAIDRITLTSTGGTTYTLTTSATNGTITRSPNASSYAAGTVVTLTASPSSGYSFTSWSGGVTGSTNPITVTMSSNVSVTANFTTATTYTLTTSATNGTITRSPNASGYAAGTVVTLTASPSSGYTFTSWSGDVSGSSSTISVTMNSNKSIVANFSSTTPPTTGAAVTYAAISSPVNVTANNTVVLALPFTAPSAGHITVVVTGLYGTNNPYSDEQRGVESFITLNSTSGGTISEFGEKMSMNSSAQYVNKTKGFAIAAGTNTVRLVVTPRKTLVNTTYKFSECTMTVVFSPTRM